MPLNCKTKKNLQNFPIHKGRYGHASSGFEENTIDELIAT
jgi:hypothetical protein